MVCTIKLQTYIEFVAKAQFICIITVNIRKNRTKNNRLIWFVVLLFLESKFGIMKREANA